MKSYKEFLEEGSDYSISIWDLKISKKAEDAGKRIQKEMSKGVNVNDALYKELVGPDKKTLRDKKNYPGSAFGRLQMDILRFLVKADLIKKPGDRIIDFIHKDPKTQEFIMTNKFEKNQKRNVNESVSSKEIEGLIKNAVSKKEVYVNSDGSQMSPSKSKQTPIKVTNYIVSTAKMKPLSLNHVRSAMDNNGIFVRKVGGNPIAVVKIDK